MIFTPSHKKIFTFIAITLLGLGLLVLWFSEEPTPTNSPKPMVPSDWLPQSLESGVAFRYPEHLGGNYVREVDWPPSVQVLEEELNCTEAGAPIERAGSTTQKTIAGKTYCVTQVREGAAGTIYDQYAYAREAGGKTVVLTFSVRTPQCGNYDEPERSACEEEASQFAPDPIVDQMFSTMTIN